MNLTITEFKTSILPGILQKCRSDGSDVQAEIKTFCGHNEITDDDGNAIEVDTVIAGSDITKDDLDDKVQKAVSQHIAKIKASSPPIAEPAQEPVRRIPATCKPYNVTAFKDSHGYTKEEKAYAYTQWIKHAIGDERAKQWLVTHGFLKTMNTIVPSAGGVTLPEQFDADLINLQNQFGAARRICRNVQMSGALTRRPRLTGGATAYWVGEGDAITPADMTLDQIELKARKLACIVPMTRELSDESAINMAEIAITEMARKLAYNEDLAFWSGDGKSTYGSILGIVGKVEALGFSTSATGPQAACASGSDANFATVALGDLAKVMALCPTYAHPGAIWVCSPTVYYSVFVRLEQAAGGNTAQSLVGGTGALQFWGYPVVLLETATSTVGTGIYFMFGNFQMAVDFGDRRALTVTSSDTAVVNSVSAFERDIIFTKATEEIDINVHDLGTTTTVGPVAWAIGHS